MTFQRMAAAAAALSFMLPLSAGAADTAADVAKLAGPDRKAKIEAGARKEGELMFYTSLLVDDGVRPLQEAFTKKYPFIKFSYIRNSTAPLVQRLLAEDRAGKPMADIVIASSGAALREAGFLQSYDTPELAAYPKNYIGPDNLWSTLRLSYNGLAYNTKLVSKADAPKKWEDLLDPKWKGKMIWNNAVESGGPLLIHHLNKIWGEKKSGEFFDKFATQNVAGSGASGRAVLDLVIAGEHAIQVSAALHQVIRSQTEKAPVDFVMVDPVIARPDHIQFLKSAPHPYTAMMFIDYVLSLEGQNTLVQYEYLPAHPQAQPLPQTAKIVPRLNGMSENMYAPDDLLPFNEQLTATYSKVSR